MASQSRSTGSGRPPSNEGAAARRTKAGPAHSAVARPCGRCNLRQKPSLKQEMVHAAAWSFVGVRTSQMALTRSAGQVPHRRSTLPSITSRAPARRSRTNSASTVPVSCLESEVSSRTTFSEPTTGSTCRLAIGAAVRHETTSGANLATAASTSPLRIAATNSSRTLRSPRSACGRALPLRRFAGPAHDCRHAPPTSPGRQRPPHTGPEHHRRAERPPARQVAARSRRTRNPSVRESARSAASSGPGTTTMGSGSQGPHVLLPPALAERRRRAQAVVTVVSQASGRSMPAGSAPATAATLLHDVLGIGQDAQHPVGEAEQAWPRLLENPNRRPAAPPPSCDDPRFHATMADDAAQRLQRGEGRLVPLASAASAEESRGRPSRRPGRRLRRRSPERRTSGRPPLRARGIVDETVIRGRNRRTTMLIVRHAGMPKVVHELLPAAGRKRRSAAPPRRPPRREPWRAGGDLG